VKTILSFLLLLLPVKQPIDIQAAALWALSQSDPAEAIILAKTYEKDCKGALSVAVFNVYTISGGDPEWPYVYKTFINKSLEEQFKLCERFGDMIAHVRNPEYAKQGIAALKNLQLKYKEDQEEKVTAILQFVVSYHITGK
jgi:aminopeptidase N